jgi:hypothetical protein
MIHKKAVHAKIPRCGGLLCRGDDPLRMIYVFSSKVHPSVIANNLSPDDPEYEEYDEPMLFQMAKCPLLQCMTIKEIWDITAIEALFMEK